MWYRLNSKGDLRAITNTLLRWVLVNRKYHDVVGPFETKDQAEQFRNEQTVESGWDIKTLIAPEDY